MSKPAYLETWHVGDRARLCSPTDRVAAFGAISSIGSNAGWHALDIQVREGDEERARLAAAAPAMARTLLELEWGGGDGTSISPCCAHRDTHPGEDRRHRADCVLDAILTSIGFPDQASRDVARSAIFNGVAKRLKVSP